MVEVVTVAVASIVAVPRTWPYGSSWMPGFFEHRDARPEDAVTLHSAC